MGIEANRKDLDRDDTRAPLSQPRWHSSLLGKITFFLLTGIIGAYTVGASAGWVMVERSSLELWRRQAEMNAQSASFAIRNIYTFVAVDTDQTGQVTRIISERSLGDDQSILDTGFNPSDVLALVAGQTKNDVWLFRPNSDTSELLSAAVADNEVPGMQLNLPDGTRPDQFYTGFAEIGTRSYYIAYMPVVTPSGVVAGAVATSIGEADELFTTQNKLLRDSLVVLIAVLFLTILFVTLLMRQLFRPVPALIQALRQIAQNDTGTLTPFQARRDEIGRFAVAIETVREAVVEREALLQVREVAREMEYLAHHDTLTGLPNRARFSKQLEAISVGSNSGATRSNIMLLDLDRFKEVNDTHGHAVGDALLVAVSERISLLLGADDMAARLGGDEFALLQSVNEDPVLEGSRLAEALVSSLAIPFNVVGLEVAVGVSIGIARAPLHGDKPGVLLKHADIALYQSKSAGRGCFHFFRDGMAMAKAGPSALEHELGLALEREELELNYQPIFAAEQGTLIGYEALLRWRHPQMGLISPDNFITLAEETGLIVPIGTWVIQQACRDAVLLENGTTMSVNVSVRQLQKADLVDELEAALRESGLSPHRLLIEVTESILLANETAISTLINIHALGVGLVIDDFGTGYSGLSYLLKFPVRKIKIDRSFITGISTDSGSRAIVTSTIELAHKLGIKVTAEGIETKEQLDVLRSAGCDLAQGFLLGRPAPVGAFLHDRSKTLAKKSSRGAR
jgi:diguanylate cyclase (GGDEF)-like protein